MFKCQKVQITADAESALRPSSVRVVTRKRKDRKKRGKEEEVRWEGGKRVDGVETERYEPMRNQKKKKCIIVGCFIFSLVELLQWVRGEVGEGQESSGGGWDAGVEGSLLLCVRVFFFCCCCFVRIGPVISCCRATALSLDAWRHSGA